MNIGDIKRKSVILGPTTAIHHPSIQKLCLCPYFNHPQGCPNYGRRADCPPRAVYFPEIFKEKVYIAATVFNFEDYLNLKRVEHINWTERALRNPRHWQGYLRSELKKLISEMGPSRNNDAIFNPEAMGVNVTQTCKNVGLSLEWPPKKIVCQVALIGQRKDCFKVVTEDLKSVGLLGASKIQYKIGEWVYPSEPLSNHYRKGGGLWVYSKKSDAFNGKRYVERKYGIRCRVFSCQTGEILTHTPKTFHRVKTNKVMLLNEL